VIIQFIAWQIKHFLCDFPLQNKYMLGKFKPFPDFIMPLLWHCFVNACGTAILVFMFNWPIWFITLDLVSHFIIDRLKASPKIGGRFKPDQSIFWHILGLDQLAHSLIGILMVYLGTN
jgi:hypothetical protein